MSICTTESLQSAPELDRLGIAQQQAHEQAQYRAALASFDWQYEFSDEHRRWADGTNALARLKRMQRQLDPSGEIWMQTPGAHTHGAPQPCLLEAA